MSFVFDDKYFNEQLEFSMITPYTQLNDIKKLIIALEYINFFIILKTSFSTLHVLQVSLENNKNLIVFFGLCSLDIRICINFGKRTARPVD
jgi:hypothetical protein